MEVDWQHIYSTQLGRSLGYCSLMELAHVLIFSLVLPAFLPAMQNHLRRKESFGLRRLEINQSLLKDDRSLVIFSIRVARLEQYRGSQ